MKGLSPWSLGKKCCRAPRTPINKPEGIPEGKEGGTTISYIKKKPVLAIMTFVVMRGRVFVIFPYYFSAKKHIFQIQILAIMQQQLVGQGARAADTSILLMT